MFLLRVFKVIGCLITLVWVLFSVLGSLVFLLLASYDDRRTPDDFVLIVKPHAFQSGRLEYFTRKGGGDTESCKVPIDSHMVYPVGSKILVSVSIFSGSCTLTALIE